MGRARTLPVVALLAVSLGLLAPTAASELTTGVLRGERNSSFVCSAVNASGASLDDLVIALRRDTGAVLVGPTEFDGVPDGEARSISYTIPFGGFGDTVYCVVSRPGGAFVAGSLRLEDPNGETQAEAALRSDLPAAIQAVIDKAEAAAP